MFSNHLFPPYRTLRELLFHPARPIAFSKKAAHFELGRSSLLLALILPGFDFLTVLASFREESLWADSGLMSRWKCAFARFLLPKCCDPQTNAEPKRNIPGVS